MPQKRAINCTRPQRIQRKAAGLEPIDRALANETDPDVAELEQIAVAHDDGVDALVVDERAVGAAVVAQDPAPVLEAKGSVVAGNAVILDGEIAVGTAAEGEARVGHGNLGRTVDIEEDELGHGWEASCGANALNRPGPSMAEPSEERR